MNSTYYNFSNINYSLEAYIYIYIHTHISVKLTSGLLFGKKKTSGLREFLATMVYYERLVQRINGI